MKTILEQIREIVGEEHFEEFCNTLEDWSFGEPEEWEYNGDLFELAHLCHEWYTDSTVLLARKIDNAIRVQFNWRKRTYFELPYWTEYYCVSDLIDASHTLINEESDRVCRLPEFKEHFDIIVLGGEDEEEDEE